MNATRLFLLYQNVRSMLQDLLRGLFCQPTTDAPAGCDYAATLEERYSKPRRCC